MRTHSYKCLAAHLKKWGKPGMHLALGLSGGPDSMALYHLLCEALQHFDFALSLLHVDHGWRPESGAEALELSKLPFPFYQKKIESQTVNCEAHARDNRYAFFEEMRRKIGFDALLLAHHSDDLAETALKRICEGAALHNQVGMRPVSHFGALEIWRPLLKCRKEELIDYLGKRPFFTDATNESEEFLRGRMRKTMLPDLEATFGKRCIENLAWHAEKMGELSDYFERKIAPYFAAYDGVNLELEAYDPYELTLFLQKVCKGISQRALADFISLVQRRQSGGEVAFSGGKLRYERGRVMTYFLESGTLVKSER